MKTVQETVAPNPVMFIRPASWLKGLVFGTLLVVLYYSALDWLVTNDWPREDYSSCALIPFVVLYLIWEKRQQLAALPSISSWMGGIPLGCGLLLFWLGELAGEFFTLYLSLWLVLVGLCWLQLGWRKLKVIAFPVGFSLATFPLPIFVNTQMSLKLKLLSSHLGVAILQLWGMSAFREGNVIDLGFTKLQVVDACSGIRYLVPLIAMAVLLAYYYRAAAWKRLVVILSAIPISVITNGLRIASVGILYPIFGAQVAEGFFHDFSGWFIFMFSLGLLLGEIWLLKRIFPERVSAVAANEPSQATNERVTAPLSESRSSLFFTRHFLAALLCLTVTVAAAKGVDFREKTPINRPLAEFPVEIGEWRGTRTAMEPHYRNALKFSDYAIIDYRDPRGREINFYTAYYASQTKGGSVHTPATCLPGSGWDFQESGVVPVALNGTFSLPVSRAFMEKDGQRQLTYYWFPQRGRVLNDLFSLKLYAFWDALTRQRTDGSLVRIITPVNATERVEDAEARMQSFVRLVVPQLDAFLPGKVSR
ncbi:VPLPA-CTERM-specific exosortase XrtD [Geobacter argillaceus]|uniref:Exosortase D (VPLPA-CTERM-specific) n=1 Tax=Geobacter argillaceus TaxID=345631 RepID=A0A562VM81_9BACT|nr:VPLPA-CTERM-specific exosortase XrtD [Geobacter argillaceus]TWJ19066.1 exosortase D (VPLPA-CTERM-specific) [Geobacter argillaceus]